MAAQRIGYDIGVMKKIKLFALTGTAVLALGSTAWAGPHSGGGGLAGGGHFGGSHFGGYSGAPRSVPGFSGGPRFSGRGIGGLSGVPQQFYYYGGPRTSAQTSHPFSTSTNRSATRYPDSAATITRQQNRAGSVTARTRVSDPRTSTTQNRQPFNANHALERHDANWHRDWDRHHAHFHKGHIFVFIDGFWWGLYPWDYYSYYADDYYPYDYYDYDYYPYGYDDQSAYVDSDQYGSSSTVSVVQSELAKLGYYRGTIDGVAGDETQAAIARYQQDHDLSVTGTVTAAILQSLRLTQKAS
jgi:hypothetical protein